MSTTTTGSYEFSGIMFSSSSTGPSSGDHGNYNLIQNNIITGGRSVIEGLLQPGEIKTVVIETPYDSRMSSNGWNFSHANGTCKIQRVPKLEVPKEQAGGPAATPAAPPQKK